MAIVMKGAPVADALSQQLAARCSVLKERGVEPCLAIVRVGESAADISYENSAKKRCATIGIAVKSVVLPERVTQEDALETVSRLNGDSSVHGVLIFRPLPRQLDEREICEKLDPFKDVDGIGSASMASVYSSSGAGFAPCTAQAVIEMLKFYEIPIAGKNAAVLGRSLVIGRPVSMLLLRENATPTICHTKTADLSDVFSRADIVVAAAGHINSVMGEQLHSGQAVVDVGINVDEASGKLVGDVEYAAAEGVVSAISPVPGGVGAVTTAVLASHVIEAAERQG